MSYFIFYDVSKQIQNTRFWLHSLNWFFSATMVLAVASIIKSITKQRFPTTMFLRL